MDKHSGYALIRLNYNYTRIVNINYQLILHNRQLWNLKPICRSYETVPNSDLILRSHEDPFPKLPEQKKGITILSHFKNYCRQFHIFSKVYASSGTNDSDNSTTVHSKKQTTDSEIGYVNPEKLHKLNRSQQTESIYPEVSDEEVDAYLVNETCQDRVHDLFFRKIEGDSHPKWAFLKTQLFAIGIAMFAVIGTLARTEARKKFIEKHKTSVFINKYDAARRLSQIGAMALINKGFGAALKSSIFLSMFIVLPTTLATYYNENSPLYFMAGGALSGFVLKFSLGPRGIVVGLLGGSISGLSYSLIAAVPVYLGAYPTEEQQHRRYIKSYLSVEKYYSNNPDVFRKRELKDKNKVIYDEKGIIPKTEQGRIIRRRLRRMIGLTEMEENIVDEAQLEGSNKATRCTWSRDEQGNWVRREVTELESKQEEESTAEKEETVPVTVV